MKIRLFTIPNMLTLGNLICGSSAVVALLMHADFELAFWLVVASAVFDFFDGFAARLLKSVSAIGVELDSLADMVSFGLVPAVAMFCLWDVAPSSDLPSWMRYLTLTIVAFSALRLAKFNIDDTQTTEFCGLPTPANGLFCLSLAMLMAAGSISLPQWAILTISIGMAYMLISPIRMFALKFKGFGWQGNQIRYSFLALCVVLIAAFTRFAVPAIILLYIIISAIRWAVNKK
ncbi:MAG: CDP-diacylglycerol--serine O-phosphatidyltransferase [Alistipes sp.]|nr:CDP-diacylglycerol--serine O-phosphatidyltransferase [Alistipes sp.]MBO5985094.1 CDP-diacylglycerol--serine O-phosphatidyltransferase [Rikenellaceae bacterium]